MNRPPTALLVILSLLALLLLLAHCATPPAPDTADWRAATRDNVRRERDVTNPPTSLALSATDELTETVYLPLTCRNWPPFADWGATGDLLGWAVSTAGDVNGDGYADIIVGAPRYSNGETEEGAALLYLGGPGGPAASPAWTGESDQPYAWFGYSIAAAGDVNGDGYGDVIVGAPRYDITGTVALTDAGQVFLYYGGPAGIVTSTVWITHAAQAHARFGSAVAAAGDVNGDGFGDVIVTANGYDAEETNEGAAFLYHGGPTGLDTTAAWAVHPTDQAYANFGRSASTAGDVNGDGYSDVIVGASWYDSGDTDD
ncbi:MAG: integrin alpha, partial [Chloroflexota bacterium]|nr:integrin alpha [Chloroflexota bacterium]